jgi:branched-chain amino acid transport system permease protein
MASVLLAQSRSRAGRRLGGALALAAVLALLVMVPQAELYYVRLADDVLIYTLLALGLNLVIGYAGLLDLGFVAFYAVGAYTYALLASPQFGIHLPFLVILPIGAALAACFGILLGIPVLPLRGDYLAIVTLGFGEIIRILLNNMDAVTGGPQGVMMIDAPRLAGYALISPRSFYWLLLGLCAVVGVLVLRLENCDPRGSGRRPRHRHRHCAREARRIRDQCIDRGPGGCDLCLLPTLCQPGKLHLQRIDPDSADHRDWRRR